MKDKLSEFDKEFIDQYFINGFNSTKAYQDTVKKLKGKEIKYTSARSNGWKYKEKLKEEIQERKKEIRGSDEEVTKIVTRLKNKSEYDLTRIMTVIDNKIYLKNTEEWDELDKLVVDEIEQTKNGIKIKTNKMESLRLLGEYRGLFDKENNLETVRNTGLEGMTFEELMKLSENLEEDGEENEEERI